METIVFASTPDPVKTGSGVLAGLSRIQRYLNATLQLAHHTKGEFMGFFSILMS